MAKESYWARLRPYNEKTQPCKQRYFSVIKFTLRAGEFSRLPDVVAGEMKRYLENYLDEFGKPLPIQICTEQEMRAIRQQDRLEAEALHLTMTTGMTMREARAILSDRVMSLVENAPANPGEESDQERIARLQKEREEAERTVTLSPAPVPDEPLSEGTDILEDVVDPIAEELSSEPEESTEETPKDEADSLLEG